MADGERGRDGPLSGAQRRAAPLLAAAAVVAIEVGTAMAAGSPPDRSAQDHGGVTDTWTEDSGRADVPADLVRSVASEVALTDDPGFGKVSVDFDAAQVVVLWAGDPPSQLTEAAKNRPYGVQVVIVPVDHSEAELAAASDRLLAGAAEEGVGILMVGRRPDLSGLVAYAEPTDITRHHAGAVAERLAEIAGVPVTVRAGGGIAIK